MTTFAKRLAAQDATHTQPATAPGAVALDGLARVLGATWRKTAMLAEEWAQRELVESDQRNQELLSHAGSPSIESVRAKKLAVAAKFGYNTPSSKASRQAAILK